MRKLLSFFMAVVSVLFVSNARAELHVDIVLLVETRLIASLQTSLF